MEIRFLNKAGVPRAEVAAHQEIARVFDASAFSKGWRGYASFRLARAGAGAGSGDDDFDLVLVTARQILVVELKNWHGQRLMSNGGRWFLDGRDMGTSPALVSNLKAKKLANALTRELGRPKVPFIASVVVLHGAIREVDLSGDPAVQGQSVMSLTDFLRLSEEAGYRRAFHRPSSTNPLQFLPDYDRFFKGRDVRPRELVVHGFKPETEPIWKHPRNLYSEFRAESVDSTKHLALLRQWDFDTLGTSLIGEGERAFIALREQRVYDLVKEQNPELSLAMLQPVVRSEEREVVADFRELYKLPAKLVRVSEFVNGGLTRLVPTERLALVKVLLLRFAELHELGVAHRDVAAHSLWVDAPSRVIVSGFPAAYVPEMKSVGGYAERIRVASNELPEGDSVAEGATPFRRDVFMLGVQSHHILYGRMPPRSEYGYHWQPTENDSFPSGVGRVLSKALQPQPAERFRDAREMLNAFIESNHLVPPRQVNRAEFESFRAVIRQQDLPEDELFVDEDECLFYRSQLRGTSVSVKVWHGVESRAVDDEARVRLITFLERGRTLRVAEIQGVAPIFECGVARRSLLVVTHWAEGLPVDAWIKTGPGVEARISVATQLVDAIERLHSRGVAHGDVQPTNLIVDPSGRVTLIDLLDFSSGGGERFTTAYMPPDFIALSPIDRDCYATARVVDDLFSAGALLEDAAKLKDVAAELTRIVERPSGATLVALQTALESATRARVAPPSRFTLAARDESGRWASPVTLISDNGCFHVEAQNSRHVSRGLFIRVTGVNGALEFDCLPGDGLSGDIKLRTVLPWQLIRVHNRSVASLDARLAIEGGSSTRDVARFVEAVLSLPGVKDLQATQAESCESAVTVEPPSSPVLLEAVDQVPRPKAAVWWEAILSAEESVLTTLTVRGAVESTGGASPTARIPCDLEWGDIDRADGEEVEVEHEMQTGEWRLCGYLDFEGSWFGEPCLLVLNGPRRTRDIRVGDRLRMRGRLERLSLTRRSDAVSRIARRRAVIGNLLDYFEPGGARVAEPKHFAEPTPAELAPYSEGPFALNDSQVAAVRLTLSTGPISLVQGPPGTGKTLFIASLLHLLVTKRGAKRILVVSQSHEGVNNVLEKADELFRMHGHALDAVRLGHEDHASDAVSAFQVDAIQRSYRDLFRAEFEARVTTLVNELRLPAEYVSRMIRLWRHLGELAARYEELQRQASSERLEEWQVRVKLQADRARELFAVRAASEFGIRDPGEPREIVARLESAWAREHNIDSPDAISRLRKAYRLACEWVVALGSSESNFSEFQAKTRAIVADTLVGIGRRASAVVQNEHEWVIVDEAARASPSELAVAIQAGQRVLLVGDHKQLPPTYADEVRREIEESFPGQGSKLLDESEFQLLFESPYGSKAGSSLWQQYRMAPSICEVVSQSFYEGKLTSGRVAVDECYGCLPDIFGREVTWLDTAPLGATAREGLRGDGAYFNHAEANVVMSLLRLIADADQFVSRWTKLLKSAEPGIGIVCMYSEQRRLLQKLCLEATWLGELRGRIKIDTVDGYQGKENRIVILTAVRNNAEMNVGFVRSANRINVALSRAMDRLLIVGATSMWTGRNAALPLGRALQVIQMLALLCHFD